MTPAYLDKIRPENYQRAFFFRKLGYLLMDVVISHYKKRDWLAIYANDMLGTYIPHTAVAVTLREGKELFSSDENFKVFEAGFHQVINESRTHVQNVLARTSAEVSDFYDLRDAVNALYHYFEKTEFFFTDGCYGGEMTEVLRKNLFVLGDDLKMESRPLLVELFTTCLYHLADLAARAHEISAEDIRFYNLDEVARLLETGESVEAAVVSGRKRSYVLYCENDAVIPIKGEEKTLVLERFKETDYSQVREFTGVIANKGKVTAPAKVVLPELDQPYDVFVKKLYSMHMNQGDILITETTSPDFVPLMKKAGGIIANQGGLNSHAAIMSRELRVPCLVGTYHATDIVHTGDLIELDADTGIVRVLRRATYKEDAQRT